MLLGLEHRSISQGSLSVLCFSHALGVMDPTSLTSWVGGPGGGSLKSGMSWASC